MNIYKHEGAGHYIGSVVIVLTEDELKAEEMIKKYLVENGLPNEKVYVEGVPNTPNSIIYAQNGDY